MNFVNLFAIGGGAVLGAWARWGLSAWLNPVFPSVPLGTLTANLVGGFIIGVAITVAEPLGLSLAARLFLTTGFLGALTTFSAFSAETVSHLLRAEYFWAAVLMVAHLAGSLLMTGAGIAVVRAVLAR